MQLLQKTIDRIESLDKELMARARVRVDNLIKPINSLGKLEELAVQLVGITRNLNPVLDQKAIIIMAADHGVYEEGISSNPQEVTLAQTLLFPKSVTGVCVIGRTAGAKIVPVDIGVNGVIPDDAEVMKRKIKNGTSNMTKGPAMTREEAIKSIEVGIEIVNKEVKKGITVIGTGEMGIGNTTPSTAILSVLGNYAPQVITGRGAGVGEGGIAHKVETIEKAIAVNQPNPQDPLDVLSKVGGLEIGGMAGVMLGAAANQIPVVVDGYISTVAAILAASIEPKAKEYFIASHASAETGGQMASEFLGIKPMLHMDMCLGEGSGAALSFPILDAAVSMLKNMATFADVGMEI
ncbi:nicotinate-nucleotide--dimethylbenzimidazole phosphoribosyltransferase [Virgibacillus halodenitrificans]|uniref:nicotinate-nucleotide--dimethylbenzimidazole phosphoribosyltransferase n=1 Tax=Virgibacillus halodenitrificans TaxID=1482 RepID=UPI0024C0C177|nr:nicotinate-nucleotide--dimethylbenzimidazole phosphoribosyltransferase [Virgibacillus halodenitrificans]WHX28018.1 nicotinate-nucleotide--dimethylbenzimidazole phosphoribosyltransferase [Virgibacillus halodenitrificans]